MAERVRAWLEQKLSIAEQNKTCLTAGTRCELRRLKRFAAKGQIVEVQPSVFARTSYWDNLKPAGRTRHLMRSLQDLNPDWVFAGPTAALAHGLSVSNRYLDKTWFATSRKTHRRQLAHRGAIVVSGDTAVTIGGLRLTSLERTVGDCLRIMDFRSGLAIADSALRTAQCSQDTLLARLEESCTRMPGMSRMRHLVALANERAESGGESIARATMLELGFATPDLQRTFGSSPSSNGPYRVDFAWDLAGRWILGELDGFEKYVNEKMTKGRSVAQVIEDEHRRQSRIEADSTVLRVIRFGFSDVMNDEGFLDLLSSCGVPRTFALDERVRLAGGILRCR